MNKVMLPGTGLKISRLAFGTGSLHHLKTGRQRQHILASAADLGFSHFDTSPYYGFGIAERELSEFLSCHSLNLTVASKFGLYPPGGRPHGDWEVLIRKLAGRILPSLSRPLIDWSLAAAEHSLTHSLRVLHRDWIDILFLHEPLTSTLDADFWAGWLEKQRKAGKIRYWGLAGRVARFAVWLDHPIAQVVQIQDGADMLELQRRGRVPQLTYGALSQAKDKPLAALHSALQRNLSGGLLISSRSASHLAQLVQAVG